ncbi:hypothetical protein WDU94_014738, partial [Cyamophila willieti]
VSNCSTSSDHRSLYSVHSLKSVLHTAQENYKSIIGSDYPQSKVNNIWKCLSEYVEQQLVQNKSTVIPKLGMFTLIETNLQGYIHRKPVFLVNKSLLQVYGLKTKEYHVSGTVRRQMLNFSEISSKCHVNQFIVEEIVNEVIKAFEKSLQTKRNSELPFFQIGKLQVQACEIRMKFYEDFIHILNKTLFKTNSCTSLISGISQLTKTSSIISKMTSRLDYYKPSPDYCCVLPPFTVALRASSLERNQPDCQKRLIKSQSSCSLASLKTRNTQSLLSVPTECSSSKRSCCSLRPSGGSHGDACMCIVCENRFNPNRNNDLGNKILAGHCEEEKKKNIIIGGHSNTNELECKQRLEYEKKNRKFLDEAVAYNRPFVENMLGRRAKDASEFENYAIMNNRKDSKCERRRRKVNNGEEIRQQIREKKNEEICRKQADERSNKERNDKLINLLYEERIKNIQEKDCNRNKLNEDLKKQIHEKKAKQRIKSPPDYDLDALRKTPLRIDKSSQSNFQMQKGRYKTQAEYQKVQMKLKKLREERERDEDNDFDNRLNGNTLREIDRLKQKDHDKKLQLHAEKLAAFKEAQCNPKSKGLQPMGFVLADPNKNDSCVKCYRKCDWPDYYHESMQNN